MAAVVVTNHAAAQSVVQVEVVVSVNLEALELHFKDLAAAQVPTTQVAVAVAQAPQVRTHQAALAAEPVVLVSHQALQEAQSHAQAEAAARERAPQAQAVQAVAEMVDPTLEQMEVQILAEAVAVLMTQTFQAMVAPAL